MDMLKIEKESLNKDIKSIAGIDEAGRGPLAGPVVAACVMFEENMIIEGVNDSKKLTPKKRDFLFNEIIEKAKDVAIGIVHEDEIDEVNILQATYFAMKKSLGGMKIRPDLILIDGPSSNIKHYNVKHIVNGDSKSQSIAAASIIAKVTRDRIMCQYDIIYPEYKFINHKGYGTKFHTEKINSLKSTPIHRKSFKIVKDNLPTVEFINRNYGFEKLAKKIIASDFIKRGYDISVSFIDLNQNKYYDFMIKNHSGFIVVKVLCKTKQYKIIEANNQYDDNIKKIKDFMFEKDIQSNFTFNVISLDFKKDKRPISKILFKKEVDVQ